MEEEERETGRWKKIMTKQMGGDINCRMRKKVISEGKEQEKDTRWWCGNRCVERLKYNKREAGKIELITGKGRRWLARVKNKDIMGWM